MNLLQRNFASRTASGTETLIRGEINEGKKGRLKFFAESSTTQSTEQLN